MRMTTQFTIVAAALLAATPALAQNEAAPANTTDVTAVNTVETNVTTNEVAVTTAPATVPVDNAAAADTGYAEPAKEEHGFPWGVLGLLGLLGLIPRMRRG